MALEIIQQNTGEVSIIKPTARDLIGPFTASLCVAPRTRQAYQKNVSYYLDWLEINGRQGATREDVMAYRAYLEANRQPSTVSAYISAVRQFYQWLAAMGYHQDVTFGIKGAKAPEMFRKDALSIPQVRKLLEVPNRDTLEGKRDAAIISLMVYGGLRTIEVARADICDIRQIDGQTVLYIQGKGRQEKDNFIRLTDAPFGAIKEYLKARGIRDTAQAPLFASLSNHHKRDQSGEIVLDGGRMTTQSISRIVKTALRSAGMDSDRLTAHSLRHTAITLALKGGATAQEAQLLARHSSIETTIRFYAHNIERANNGAFDMLAKTLES